MSEIPQERAERIGLLYGKALSNFNDLGEFQLALSNAMPYRHYNWDIDRFERELERFVEAGVSSNPAWSTSKEYRRIKNKWQEKNSNF